MRTGYSPFRLVSILFDLAQDVLRLLLLGTRSLQNLGAVWNKEPRIAREEIAKHVQQITLRPLLKAYVATGIWDWLGVQERAAAMVVPGAGFARYCQGPTSLLRSRHEPRRTEDHGPVSSVAYESGVSSSGMMGGKKSGKKPKIRSLKQLKREASPRLSRFAEALLTAKTKREAAIIAGYAPKYAKEAGYHAFKQLQEKAPEVIARMGITLDGVIHKKLLPLMEFQETKLTQREGKFTEYINVDNGSIQLQATITLLRLMNAFPPEDPLPAAKTAVDVIIADMPRPNYDVIAVDVGPGPIPEAALRQLGIVAAGPAELQEPPNLKKKDPRPDR